MNILQALLQGAGVGGQQPMEPDIPVTAPVRRQMPGEDLRAAPNELKTEELIPRKGMFGMKGTIRDVVGLLGDAFLVQSGNKPMYAPQRQQEKLGSAIYQANQDPTAAADRAAIIDPETGLKMYNDIADRDLVRQRYEAQLAQQKLAQADKGYKIRAAFAGTLKDAASFAKGRKTLMAINDKYGLEGDIPEEYDQAAVSQLYDWGIDPVNREKLIDADERRAVQTRQGDARIGVAQQNAAANTLRASRPPAGRAAPRPTASNVDAQVLEKVRTGTASPAEQAYYKSRLAKGGGSTRRAPPPLPPGFVLKKK